MRRPAAAAVGFTLLELVVVICLVGIFASVALDRLLRYQEIAEKAAMDATIGALRSAEALQVAARITTGGLASVAALADENPIDWLAAPPAGYAGVLRDSAASSLPGGSWYFDNGNKELVYIPQRTRFFAPAPGDANRIRFKVIVRIIQKRHGGELSELDVRSLFQGQWSPAF